MIKRTDNFHVDVRIVSTLHERSTLEIVRTREIRLSDGENAKQRTDECCLFNFLAGFCVLDVMFASRRLAGKNLDKTAEDPRDFTVAESIKTNTIDNSRLALVYSFSKSRCWQKINFFFFPLEGGLQRFSQNKRKVPLTPPKIWNLNFSSENKRLST